MKHNFAFLLLLLSLQGFCQNNNGQKKADFLGVHIILPNSTAKTAPLSISLNKDNRLLLTDYSISNGLSVGYTTKILVNNNFVSSVEGGVNFRYFAGSVSYRRYGATLWSNGENSNAFVEDRSELDFQNAFLGTTIRLRKNLFKSNKLDLICGIEFDGRVLNKYKLAVDYYRIEDNSASKIDYYSSNQMAEEENLIFFQSNIVGGIGVNQLFINNLSLELLFSYSLFRIHNAGAIKINPIIIGMKYQI